jgi:hypothetical protein
MAEVPLVPEQELTGITEVARIEGVGPRLKRVFALAGCELVHKLIELDDDARKQRLQQAIKNLRTEDRACSEPAELSDQSYKRLLSLAVTVVKRVQDGQGVDVADCLDLAYMCPLTAALFEDPVITPDGFTYERAAIMKWLETHSTEPETRNPLAADKLISNRAMRDATLSYMRHHRKFSIMC